MLTVIACLCGLLSTEVAVLRRRRSTGALILWVRTGEDSEGWFSVEPAGLRCLYRH